MRHRKKKGKLNRRFGNRQALLRGQTVSLLLEERIKTTKARSCQVRRLAEKMVTLAKRETLHARRLAFRFLRHDAALKKLFDTLAYRYAERQGGYTRTIKIGTRAGDAAEVVYLELVDRVVVEKVEKVEPDKKEKKGKVPAAKPAAKENEKAEDKSEEKDEQKTKKEKKRFFSMPFRRKGPKAAVPGRGGKSGPGRRTTPDA